MIKDLIDHGEIKIKYAPTDQKWPDVITKPKQGGGFKDTRAGLMNVLANYNGVSEAKKTRPNLLPTVKK